VKALIDPVFPYAEGHNEVYRLDDEKIGE